MAAEAGLQPSGLVEVDVKEPIVESWARLIVEEIEFKLVEAFEWIIEIKKSEMGALDTAQGGASRCQKGATQGSRLVLREVGPHR